MNKIVACARDLNARLVGRAEVEVAVVVVVGDNSAKGVVVSGVDGAHSTGLLAMLQVVGVAIGEDGELKHHRSTVAVARQGDLLVVVELVGVAVATSALGGRVLDLRADLVDVDVTAGALTAVSNGVAADNGRSSGEAGEGKGKGDSELHLGGCGV